MMLVPAVAPAEIPEVGPTEVPVEVSTVVPEELPAKFSSVLPAKVPSAMLAEVPAVAPHLRFQPLVQQFQVASQFPRCPPMNPRSPHPLTGL